MKLAPQKKQIKHIEGQMSGHLHPIRFALVLRLEQAPYKTCPLIFRQPICLSVIGDLQVKLPLTIRGRKAF
jgi:hypothetical protein